MKRHHLTWTHTVTHDGKVYERSSTSLKTDHKWVQIKDGYRTSINEETRRVLETLFERMTGTTRQGAKLAEIGNLYVHYKDTEDGKEIVAVFADPEADIADELTTLDGLIERIKQ